MKKSDGAGRDLAAVEEYFSKVSEPARRTLLAVRATIRAEVPAEATEVISYGLPTFRYQKPIVAIGAFAKHCSFFPMSGRVLQLFENELKPYETSKGTIRFPLDKPLPPSLVRKLVRARLTEIEVPRVRKPAAKTESGGET